MPYKYIGRTTNFKGKTLWELLGNLKNFGIGRIVTRSTFERYPEPTYLKIVKVETLANPENPSIDDVRKIKVLAESTFRGFKSEKLVCIESASYKTDYKLIPKDEESDYCTFNGEISEKILPRMTKFPPLLRELILREMQEQHGNGTEVALKEPELELVYKHSPRSRYRIAEKGEQPSKEFPIGVGTPITPRLYKNVKL